MADEPILVVDIGSSSVKAGFSGEDVPSYIFPSTTTKSGIKNMEVSLRLFAC
jgi:actin-related protein